MEATGRVSGTLPARHRAKFYGLSTCIWCRKTRQLLDEMGVPFEFAYVDLLEGEERESTLAELVSFGRGETFPTIVIDGSSCVIGFRPDEIRQALTS
jgi:glutaredoxin-like protein NrdH